MIRRKIPSLSSAARFPPQVSLPKTPTQLDTPRTQKPQAEYE